MIELTNINFKDILHYPTIRIVEGETTFDRNGKRKIRALVLTPTRELAIQIQENFEMYGKYMDLRSTVV
ncbi:DEAD/DEAH box helicase, partial [Erysipelothrix rhusiopathiae]|nr:DEAD/DEAH box helicase [Erysipelothrix rhusiopathiae]